MTPLHIEALVQRWKARYARSTTYSRAAALRRTLRWYEDTTNSKGLARCVPRVPYPNVRQIVATPAQLDALHAAADPWMRVWLRLTVALALAQNEVRTLSAAHYNAEARTVSFTRKKTGEPNTLPVPDDLAAIFESAPDFGDPAMPFLQRWQNGHPLKKHTIEGRWRRLKARAGVPAEVTAHDLRRTTASATLDLTNDLRAVQQLLGHRSLGATIRYCVGHKPDVLRPILAQLWTPKTEVKQ